MLYKATCYYIQRDDVKQSNDAVNIFITILCSTSNTSAVYVRDVASGDDTVVYDDDDDEAHDGHGDHDGQKDHDVQYGDFPREPFENTVYTR